MVSSYELIYLWIILTKSITISPLKTFFPHLLLEQLFSRELSLENDNQMFILFVFCFCFFYFRTSLRSLNLLRAIETLQECFSQLIWMSEELYSTEQYLENDAIGQWLSTGRDLPLPLPPRHIWHYLKIFLVVTLELKRGKMLLASSRQRPGMFLKSCTAQDSPTVPTKNCLAQNGTSAKAEKPCFVDILATIAETGSVRSWPLNLNQLIDGPLNLHHY